MFIMKAHAVHGTGGQKDGRGKTMRPSSQQRRGNETMSSYYRRTGTSMLGRGYTSTANVRSRGGNTITPRG